MPPAFPELSAPANEDIQHAIQLGFQPPSPPIPDAGLHAILTYTLALRWGFRNADFYAAMLHRHRFDAPEQIGIDELVVRQVWRMLPKHGKDWTEEAVELWNRVFGIPPAAGATFTTIAPVEAWNPMHAEPLGLCACLKRMLWLVAGGRLTIVHDPPWCERFTALAAHATPDDVVDYVVRWVGR